MKLFEALNFHRELLNRLHASGARIDIDDVCYLDLYEDYSRMVKNGDKVSYIVAVLSERHSICVRTVYSLVKRLSAECMPCTA
ncbi:hypothetical protein [uncultured Duncaniella sp.]|uniref:hypothetical protein n=1 Tax=uncultured Duncaniella sp. TaxID=2768039 RepID=UPI0026482B0C|nr:hypothetical protein [uncultured Duncaniella sp.]